MERKGLDGSRPPVDGRGTGGKRGDTGPSYPFSLDL